MTNPLQNQYMWTYNLFENDQGPTCLLHVLRVVQAWWLLLAPKQWCGASVQGDVAKNTKTLENLKIKWHRMMKKNWQPKTLHNRIMNIVNISHGDGF
jgi:hypothetical protein